MLKTYMNIHSYMTINSNFLERCFKVNKGSHSKIKQKRHIDLNNSQDNPRVTSTNESRSNAISKRELPIYEAKNAIIDLIIRNQTTVLVGETGSGKTTQVPQYILDNVMPQMRASVFAISPTGVQTSGFTGRVAIIQPRVIAAVSIAAYVAKERNVMVGDEVGYVVRFHHRASSKTRLTYMTDGILLKELVGDPLLSAYSAVVVDEAHERTVVMDVLLGLLKKVLVVRPQCLKLVVMSATIQAERFAEFFNNCPVGVVAGRAYPVIVHHTVEPQMDVVDAVVNTVVQIHTREGPGDILVFLPGREQIHDCERILVEKCKLIPGTGYRVLTLYAALPLEQQQEVLAPSRNKTRRIVLATNIAETSLTVEGVKFVVDSGLAKLRYLEGSMETLRESSISRAQALQRSGRAGRVSKGKCYRLYTELSFNELDPYPKPEILRVCLANVILHLKAMGIHQLLSFDWIDPPNSHVLIQSLKELYELGALSQDKQFSLTTIGKLMALLPLEPRASLSVIYAVPLNIVKEVIKITSFLCVEHVLLNDFRNYANSDNLRAEKLQLQNPFGDHISYLRIVNSFEAQCALYRNNRKKLVEWANHYNISYRQIVKVRNVALQLNELVDQNFALITNELTHIRGESITNESLNDYVPIRRAFCYGYFHQTAYFDTKQMKYVSYLSQQTVEVHPSSVLSSSNHNGKRRPPCILFHSLLRTNKRYIRDILTIHEEWLAESSPKLFVNL